MKWELCSCVSALPVPVSNADYQFFLLDIGMYRNTSVFGPFEDVTLLLVVVGLAGSSSSFFEDGMASPSCFLGTACYFCFLGVVLPMDLISFGRASSTMSSSMWNLASAKCDLTLMNGLSPCITFTLSQ
ncbi:hypothetical protein ACFX2I_027786 [Malus domestica]